jgi:hypothetical protein
MIDKDFRKEVKNKIKGQQLPNMARRMPLAIPQCS